MSSRRRAFVRGAWLEGLLLLVTVSVVMTVIGIDAGTGPHAVGPYGARVYVDAYHSVRHPPEGRNLRHHHAYHTVSGTQRWVDEMRRAGADVHVEREHGLEADALADFDVVVLGEPSYEARFVTPAERAVLLSWVEQGGGLLAFAARPGDESSIDAFDRTFGELGVRVRSLGAVKAPNPDLAKTVPRVSRTRSLATAPRHPVMEGVGEHMVRAGSGLETRDGVAFFADTDGDTDAGAEARTAATVAAFEHGRGRVVVLADVDAFTNPMLYYGDHLRLAHNALTWLAPVRGDPAIWWIVPGVLVLLGAAFATSRMRTGRRASTVAAIGGAVVAAGLVGWRGVDVRERDVSDVLIHVGHGSGVDLSSDARGGYFAAYAHMGKDPRLRPWANAAPIRGGYDALVLAAPTEPFSEADLASIRGYAARGATVIYLADLDSLRSEAGRQLTEHFGVHLELGEPVLTAKTPYRAHGPPSFLDGIFRVYVWPRAVPVRAGEGLEPLVHLSPGGRHVDDRMWTRRHCVYDLVSETRAGALGEFVVVAPAELFDNASLGSPYRVGDEVVQQTSDLLLRLLQRAVGRDPFVGLAAG